MQGLEEVKPRTSPAHVLFRPLSKADEHVKCTDQRYFVLSLLHCTAICEPSVSCDLCAHKYGIKVEGIKASLGKLY